MAGFEPLREERVHHGHVIDVYRSWFRAPDGTEIVRDVVRHPGAVAALPLLDSGEVVLVRQFRAPFGREMLEIPAGKLDVAGEDLAAAAARELAEEVGLAAGRMEPLVRYNGSVGFCDEVIHVFLATELTPVAHERQGPEEEHMEEVRLTLDDALAAVWAGDITDGKTVVGLLAARVRAAGR